MRPRRASLGFTLIELLVVIAIIGILAGFIAAGLPRAIEMAKMASTRNTFNQIRTILTAYYTDQKNNNSYPPAYGYLSADFLHDRRFANTTQRPQMIFDELSGGLRTQANTFHLYPWMSFVREHGHEDLYDRWSRGIGFDTDHDGSLSRLEFSLLGQFDPGSQNYFFDNRDELYTAANPTDPETLQDLMNQLDSPGPRPFIYVPVNSRQASIFRKIVYDAAPNDSNPRISDLDANAFQRIQELLHFPPPSYDAYVLISMGPAAGVSGTGGIIQDFGPDTFQFSDFESVPGAIPNYSRIYQYHLVGLATYFMATRDSERGGEGDGELDFDFKARTSAGQGKDANNDLPGRFPKAAGPVIYVGGA